MNKKNYASLLNQITELYIKALTRMYFWDMRIDKARYEHDNESKSRDCGIRNAFAHEASAYFLILDDELSQEDIEEMHREAKQKAESMS